MKKRVELTQEQKEAVMKVFKKSDAMKDLISEFERSFKVLESRIDENVAHPQLENHDNDYYVIWSSILNRTFQIPIKDILGQQESKKKSPRANES